jgi:FabA-like domain
MSSGEAAIAPPRPGRPTPRNAQVPPEGVRAHPSAGGSRTARAQVQKDPVQPGSLGVEAMLQWLQFYLLERNLHEGIPHPAFWPIASDRRI